MNKTLIILVSMLFFIYLGIHESYTNQVKAQPSYNLHKEDSLYQIWRDSTNIRIAFKVWYNKQLKYNEIHKN